MDPDRLTNTLASLLESLGPAIAGRISEVSPEEALRTKTRMVLAYRQTQLRPDAMEPDSAEAVRLGLARELVDHVDGDALYLLAGMFALADAPHDYADSTGFAEFAKQHCAGCGGEKKEG